jgi:hypothetical protein
MSKTNEVVEAMARAICARAFEMDEMVDPWWGDQATQPGNSIRLSGVQKDRFRAFATAALTASEPLLAQAPKIVGGTEYAPCPTCRQYSHSIGEDQLADAFMHFQSMHSHRGDGIPTQHSFDERTRDAAQVLMIAAQGVAQARAQAVEDAAKVADPPLMHRKGKPGLWRRRRAAIAAEIRTLAQPEGEGKA